MDEAAYDFLVDLEEPICDLEGHVFILEVVGSPIFDEVGTDWENARGKRLNGHQCHVMTDARKTALNHAFQHVLFGMRDLKNRFYAHLEKPAP